MCHRRGVDDAQPPAVRRGPAPTSGRRGPSRSAAAGTAAGPRTSSGAGRTPGRSRRTAVSRTTTPGRRRVTAQAACERWRWAGWASRELEPLGQEQEPVEEPARQANVVIEHEQPVDAGERVGGEQQVRGSRTCRARRPARGTSTAWRERRSSATAAVEQRRALLVHHRQRQHPPLGAAPRRAAQAGRLEAAGAPARRTRRRRAAPGPSRADAADLAARAREEVVAGTVQRSLSARRGGGVRRAGGRTSVTKRGL